MVKFACKPINNDWTSRQTKNMLSYFGIAVTATVDSFGTHGKRSALHLQDGVCVCVCVCVAREVHDSQSQPKTSQTDRMKDGR
eukprot:6460795-Amphidinium_carterae.2